MSKFDPILIGETLRKFALENAGNHTVSAEFRSEYGNQRSLRVVYRNESFTVYCDPHDVDFTTSITGTKNSSYNFLRNTNEEVIKKAERRIKKLYETVDAAIAKKEAREAKLKASKSDTLPALEKVIEDHGIGNLIKEEIVFDYDGEAKVRLEYFGHTVTLLHTGEAYVWNARANKDLSLPKMPLEKLFKVIRTIEE